MTRMWTGIAPYELCRQHLLGEHNELHKLAGSIRAGRRLGKLAERGYVDPSTMADRHTILVAEMDRRGYNHRSPLDLDGLDLPAVDLDPEYNRRDLAERCPACRERMGDYPETGWFWRSSERRTNVTFFNP